MRPSEKLILMLELNNYDIDNLFLKKQVESEKSGNMDLHKYNKYSDLIVCNYLYEENMDYTSRNPMSYRVGSWDDIESLDQLVIKHPDVGKQLTIKEFLSIEIFSVTEKRNILSDVTHTWLDEYREARSNSLKNIQELFFITTKVNIKYRKPSKVVFIILFILALFNTILFVRPQILQNQIFSSFSNFINSWSQLLHDTPIYSGFAVFTLLLFILYAYQNYTLLSKIRGVMIEKTSNVVRKIYNWDIEMKKVMAKNDKLLEKYVSKVLKKPERSRLEIKKLNGFEILLDKYRLYVQKVERKYYWMNKNYIKKVKYYRVTYISFILIELAFISLAFAIIRGLINV